MGRVMIGANCGQMTPCGPRVSMRTSSLHSLGGQEWGGYWVHPPSGEGLEDCWSSVLPVSKSPNLTALGQF